MKSFLRFSTNVFCFMVFFIAGCSDTLHPNRTLLISFDGFSNDYLNRVDTPHFDSLITAGVSAESLIPVFPTKTFPNHYSIATGLYPENSGLINNTMYDPEFKEWYRISDRKAVENPKWYEGEPIWNTLEKQGVRTGTMFWVGSEAPIQGMRPTYWKPYDGSISPRARIDTVLKWFAYPGEKAVDFATLYFEHVDAAGHDYGLESDSLDASIKKSDRLIGYLKKKLKEAEMWENINIVIVSDHGMIDLSANKTIMLDSIIDLNDVERIIWDPVTLIWPKDGKGKEVYNTLKAGEGNYRVYRKEGIPERYHFKKHRRVSDIIIVADSGYTILSKDFRERLTHSLPTATHGYDNADKNMQAFFLAIGPVFKKGERVETFQNIHIYELLNYLMNTNPAPNDGSLDSIKVLLK